MRVDVETLRMRISRLERMVAEMAIFAQPLEKVKIPSRSTEFLPEPSRQVEGQEASHSSGAFEVLKN
jgi:hypothetical protein